MDHFHGRLTMNMTRAVAILIFAKGNLVVGHMLQERSRIFAATTSHSIGNDQSRIVNIWGGTSRAQNIVKKGGRVTFK